MNRCRYLRIGVRANLDRRRIRPNQHRVLTSQPFRGGDADAGVATLIPRIVFFPKRAPAGVNDDSVSCLYGEFLLGQCLLKILYADLVSVRQDSHLLQDSDINQDTARDERRRSGCRAW